MESAIPFLIVAFLFGLTWLVAIGAYLGREKLPEEPEVAIIAALAPDLEKARFLADPQPLAVQEQEREQVDEAVIHSLERYLQAEHICAARFVAAPSIELLHSGAGAVAAVA